MRAMSAGAELAERWVVPTRLVEHLAVDVDGSPHGPDGLTREPDHPLEEVVRAGSPRHGRGIPRADGRRRCPRLDRAGQRPDLHDQDLVPGWSVGNHRRRRHRVRLDDGGAEHDATSATTAARQGTAGVADAVDDGRRMLPTSGPGARFGEPVRVEVESSQPIVGSERRARARRRYRRTSGCGVDLCHRSVTVAGRGYRGAVFGWRRHASSPAVTTTPSASVRSMTGSPTVRSMTASGEITSNPMSDGYAPVAVPVGRDRGADHDRVV